MISAPFIPHPPAIVFGKCRYGCRVRMVLNRIGEYGDVAVAYAVAGNDEAADWRTLPVEQSIPYLAWCVKHHEPLRGKLLKTRFSDQPCDDACTHATGGSCRCSCGGANHGIEA